MWPVGHLLRWHLLAKEYVPGERSLSAEVGTSQLTEGSLRVRGAGGRPPRGWGGGGHPGSLLFQFPRPPSPRWGSSVHPCLGDPEPTPSRL